MKLNGKIAVVTGASRGIGRDIAIKLAESGAHIFFNYNDSLDAAQETAQLIRATGVNVEMIQANIAQSEDVTAMFKQALTTFGRIDILINNAGMTRDNLIMRMKEAEWEEVLAVNLKGAFLATKAVSRTMMKQRYGKIINVTSVSGLLGNLGQANYAASKAGLIGLTKTSARELAARGINVNAVAPGFIATNMTDKLNDETKENMLASIPLGKYGTADDVANTILFLVSDAASYITGQTIAVDGGMTMY